MSKPFEQEGHNECDSIKNLEVLKITYVNLHSELSDSEEEIDIQSAIDETPAKKESPYERLISNGKS